MRRAIEPVPSRPPEAFAAASRCPTMP